MNPEEFLKLLGEVRGLMAEEKFFEAMRILENLKNLDKSEKYDYNYDLIHQLYQLDSNCTSAYNQQRILKIIGNLPIKNKSISFRELKELVIDIDDLVISEEILRREIEILILRGLLDCQIQGDQLIFSHH